MLRRMRACIAMLLMIALAMGSYPASAATPEVLSPAGETIIVDDNPEDQTDPHISGTLVVYTNSTSEGTSIGYRDLADLEVSGAIPIGEAERDSLPDVSGGEVVFNRTHSDRIAIHIFDPANAGEYPQELDPQVGSLRSGAAIGGSTVAWEDRGLAEAEYSSREIVVYDRLSSVSTRLTSDTAIDTFPAVSPDGSVIVWEKCESGTCDIWQAILNDATWTTSQLTGGEGISQRPQTNGDVVVYSSIRDGESGIYWQPVSGGVEQKLQLPVQQNNPFISGNLIVFTTEQNDPVYAGVAEDIMVYDLEKDTYYQITDTPDAKEILSDIAVGSDGVVRVVYTSEDASGDRDIHAFTFNLQSSDVTPPTLTLPDTIIVDATSSIGAVVSYIVGAEDDTDENPTVDCQPASGSAFPEGTTTVACTAIDDARNQSEGSFNVTVLDAEQQLDDLKDFIASLGLQRGTQNSLNAKLGAVDQALAKGKVHTACNVLNAFNNSVNAQAGKKLTTEQAFALLEDVARIRAAAGCQR